MALPSAPPVVTDPTVPCTFKFPYYEPVTGDLRLDREYLDVDWNVLEVRLRATRAVTLTGDPFRVPFRRWDDVREEEARLLRNYDAIENTINALFAVCDPTQRLKIPFRRLYEYGRINRARFKRNLFEIEVAVAKLCACSRQEVIRGIASFVFGRTQFPPDFGHPGVMARRYDPVTPNINLSGSGNSSPLFRDYDLNGGWSKTKSKLAIGHAFDTTGQDPPLGNSPRIAIVNASSEDMGAWAITGSPYLFPGTITTPQTLRWLAPSAEGQLVFTAVENGVRKLMVLDVTTMTVVYKLSQNDVFGFAGDIRHYAFTQDGSKMLLVFSGFGTRMYDRYTGAEISSSDIFSTFGGVDQVGWTDDGNWIWGSHAQVGQIRSAAPPFTAKGTVDSSLPHGSYPITIDPQLRYVNMAGLQIRGFENPLTNSRVWDFATLTLQTNFGGTSGGAFRGEWTQDDAWMGGDGGRDPSGGLGKLVKMNPPTWSFSTNGDQETFDYRAVPYH